MPNTRNFLLSLYQEIELFKNSFYNDSSLKFIGWKPEPITKVQSALNGADVMADIKNQDFNYIFNNSWMKVPAAITNHNLIKINKGF